MSSAIKAHPGATPHTPPPLRVMLVDDHELVRQGINFLLTSDRGIQIVAEGSSLAEGMVLARSTAVDVLVVDVSLGDGSGLDLVRDARGLRPRLGIVVLTMHDDDNTLLEALDAGASALVLKSGSADEVISAVKHAATAPDSFTAAGLPGPCADATIPSARGSPFEKPRCSSAWRPVTRWPPSRSSST